MKKTSKKRCFTCWATDETVKLQKDPYDEEILNKSTRHYYCARCIKLSNDEV